MDAAAGSLIGVGIYPIPDASRIVHVSGARIRRWLTGYSYISAIGERRELRAVIRSEVPAIDGNLALGFLELIEVLVIDGFRTAGVSWPVIHKAYAAAREILKTDHPFCDRRLRTDGRGIMLEISEQVRNKRFLNLVNNQYGWKAILDPYMHAALDYAGYGPTAWWPLGKRRAVLIDPARMFGKPIVAREGVPTKVLALARRAEKSLERVAWWYDVSMRSVRDAVEFEKRLTTPRKAA